MQLLLATNNPGKLREMRDLLKDLDLQIVSPAQIGLDLDVPEDGVTYRENASKKAIAFAHVSGLISLADDSGLEVDALGGAPGLYSARFAPVPNATDADRRAYLLKNLQGHPRPWAARFRCTIAVATPSGEVQYAEGICPGQIIPEERGSDGFGYDPVFLLPDLAKTMAELTMEEKNRLSHRARAIWAARPILAQIS
jgi:XTP/dITP diphosphohydrolase